MVNVINNGEKIVYFDSKHWAFLTVPQKRNYRWHFIQTDSHRSISTQRNQRSSWMDYVFKGINNCLSEFSLPS